VSFDKQIVAYCTVNITANYSSIDNFCTPQMDTRNMHADIAIFPILANVSFHII